MTIKIEKNIPIPSPANRKGRPSTYPFASMEVGDSFVFSGDSKNAIRLAYMAKKRHKMEFATRVEGPNSVRIWRIA